jgi:proteasome accessory factor B
VHRIRRADMNVSKPKVADFEVPKDFRLDAYVATWPWQHNFHEPLEVTLTLKGELEPLADQLFPVKAEKNDGVATLTVSATDLDGLVTYVLSLGSHARITGPEKAVARSKELAQKVLNAHGGAA